MCLYCCFWVCFRSQKNLWVLWSSHWILRWQQDGLICCSGVTTDVVLQCGRGGTLIVRSARLMLTSAVQSLLLDTAAVYANNSSHLSSTFTGRGPEAIDEVESGNVSTLGWNETSMRWCATKLHEFQKMLDNHWKLLGEWQVYCHMKEWTAIGFSLDVSLWRGHLSQRERPRTVS